MASALLGTGLLGGGGGGSSGGGTLTEPLIVEFDSDQNDLTSNSDGSAPNHFTLSVDYGEGSLSRMWLGAGSLVSGYRNGEEDPWTIGSFYCNATLLTVTGAVAAGGSISSFGHPVQVSGAVPTNSRPEFPETGLMIFDSTLGLPIWWNGTIWMDATGTAVAA